jgi:hypothetical protein
MSPVYDFACDKCEMMIRDSRTYENRLQGVRCPECGDYMEYVFPNPVFFFEGGSPTAKRKSQVTSKDDFFEGADDDR